MGVCHHPEYTHHFTSDFSSRIWLTYRYNFIPLTAKQQYKQQYTSDGGWGCMIRTGQMMLAEALLRLKVGRAWRLVNNDASYSLAHQNILRRFVDAPSVFCDLSIHRIVQIGVRYGKHPGDWYGPETIAMVFKDLVHANPYAKLSIHVATGSTIVTGRIAQYFSDTTNKPLLLLTPVRLGLQRVNSIYRSFILGCLQLSCSVGIIGGKPRHSVYFIGHTVDGKLLYLDPHSVQKAVSMDDCFPRMADLLSYHCTQPRFMDIGEMDPSMTIGFLIENIASFHQFCRDVQLLTDRTTPFFHVVDVEPCVANTGYVSDACVLDMSEEEEDWLLLAS